VHMAVQDEADSAPYQWPPDSLLLLGAHLLASGFMRGSVVIPPHVNFII
jgi:hypothetical protein